MAVFTPPQHKYDGNTVRALSEAGYALMSASSYPSIHHKLAYKAGRLLRLSSLRHHGISYHEGERPEAPVTEVSIAIAVDDGGTLHLTASNLANALRKAGRDRRSVGLMFHHAVYSTPELRRSLEDIADALAKVGPESFRPLSRVLDEDTA